MGDSVQPDFNSCSNSSTKALKEAHKHTLIQEISCKRTSTAVRTPVRTFVRIPCGFGSESCLDYIMSGITFELPLQLLFGLLLISPVRIPVRTSSDCCSDSARTPVRKKKWKIVYCCNSLQSRGSSTYCYSSSINSTSSTMILYNPPRARSPAQKPENKKMKQKKHGVDFLGKTTSSIK